MLTDLFDRYFFWTGATSMRVTAHGETFLEDSMTKTPVHPSKPELDSPRSSAGEDAIAACFILTIVGGFLPGVFFDASLLFSMIGAGSGLLLGLLMAYE